MRERQVHPLQAPRLQRGMRLAKPDIHHHHLPAGPRHGSLGSISISHSSQDVVNVVNNTIIIFISGVSGIATHSGTDNQQFVLVSLINY